MSQNWQMRLTWEFPFLTFMVSPVKPLGWLWGLGSNKLASVAVFNLECRLVDWWQYDKLIFISALSSQSIVQHFEFHMTNSTYIWKEAFYIYYVINPIVQCFKRYQLHHLVLHDSTKIFSGGGVSSCFGHEMDKLFRSQWEMTLTVGNQLSREKGGERCKCFCWTRKSEKGNVRRDRARW